MTTRLAIHIALGLAFILAGGAAVRADDAEPTTQPETEATADPNADPNAESDPESESEPESKPKSEPESKPKPASESDAEPEAAPEAAATGRRTAAHEAYAKTLWEFLHRELKPYEDWDVVSAVPIWPIGPPATEQRTYRNSRAALNPNGYGAVFVTEHLAEPKGETFTGVTVRHRVKEGFDPATGDWYWAHYLPNGTVVKTSADVAEFDRPGYVTRVEDGRLWVVSLDDPALPAFVAGAPPEEHATRVGGGPGGMTIKGTSPEAIDVYMATKPNFFVRLDDGVLWVFRAGSKEAYDYDHGTVPEKPVTRKATGPDGATLKGIDDATLDAYEIAAPGFDTALVENRIWVFRRGSEASENYRKNGEPGESVTRVGVGPGERTVRSVDRETIDAYLASLGIAEE